MAPNTSNLPESAGAFKIKLVQAVGDAAWSAERVTRRVGLTAKFYCPAIFAIRTEKREAQTVDLMGRLIGRRFSVYYDSAQKTFSVWTPWPARASAQPAPQLAPSTATPNPWPLELLEQRDSDPVRGGADGCPVFRFGADRGLRRPLRPRRARRTRSLRTAVQTSRPGRRRPRARGRRPPDASSGASGSDSGCPLGAGAGQGGPAARVAQVLQEFSGLAGREAQCIASHPDVPGSQVGIAPFRRRRICTDASWRSR